MSIPPGGAAPPAAAGLTGQQRESAMARYVAVITPVLHEMLTVAPFPALRQDYE